MGSNNTLTVNKSGFLLLGINDNSIDDDESQFIVNYEIIRANSRSASIFNLLPQSCSDLEKIASFNKKELDTYLGNNSFTSIREKDGIQLFMREKDDDKVVLGFKKDYFNHKNIIVLLTDSEERYLKLKNSLSAEGYVYRTTESQMAMYRKTTKTSHNVEVGFGEADDVYKIGLNTSIEP